MSYYGPTELWPTHARAYWNTVLPDARSAGWTLQYINAAHCFGWVRCPAGECAFMVDKTADGAERFAVIAARKVRTCAHGSAEPAPLSAADRHSAHAHDLLDQAEDLLDVAESALDRLGEYSDSLAELDRIELIIDSAEVSAESVSDADLEAAIDRAGDAESDALGESSAQVASTVIRAEVLAQEAQQTSRSIRGQRRTDLRPPILERVAAIRDRAAGLRNRLDRTAHN